MEGDRFDERIEKLLRELEENLDVLEVVKSCLDAELDRRVALCIFELELRGGIGL